MNHRNFETSLMFRSTLLNMKSVLVPVCKSTDESSSVNYLESDTVWINPNKSTSSIPHNLSYQDKSSHLYINKICPPEYSELDGQSSFRNINHCSSSQAEIEAGFQRVNIITRIGISWSNILFIVSRKHLSMFRVNLYLIFLFFDNERENFVLLSRSVYAATLTCLLGNQFTVESC